VNTAWRDPDGELYERVQYRDGRTVWLKLVYDDDE